MRRPDGVEGKRCFSTRSNMARRENDLLNHLAAMCKPTEVKIVFTEQTIWQMNHSQMAKCMRWVALEERCRLARVKAQQHIGLVGAGNVPLVHRNEHHAVAVHGLRTQSGFIELPKTRLDILPT